MPPRGRPRKPPLEKALEGRRGRLSQAVFVPRGAPFVPDHLNEDAQACAEFILANFDAKQICSIDSYILSAFAAAWAWHKAAVHVMSAPDFQPIVNRTTKDGNVVEVPSPWFRIMNEQARMMLAIAPKLWLTPADRQRLDGSYQEQSKSKFDGLIGRSASSSLSSALPSPAE